MFLKSLEIRGFKSFADKTELRFKKGVTAVVGPNGSGKSNVSDSVRWVLGEQSVKSLRGGKMEDVIFAGTQFRKPLGLAQVSLTLDNLDGTLATDYNEVTVTRRIFRSGETEYLINNQKCRLKDITELFMDTGIGKEGYSLIGQGKIDAILSGKPDERRALFEEAAGIVKYKARKEEAEKKLSNTDDNLVRIRDIISTYEERLGPLKEEKEKALKYKELAEELSVKEVSVLVENIKKVHSEIEILSKDMQERQNNIEVNKRKLDEEKRILENLEEGISELENKNNLEKEEFYNKKEEASRNEKDIELYIERTNNFKNLISKEEEEIKFLDSKIAELKEEQRVIEEDFRKKESEKKNLNIHILELDKSIVNINEVILKIENELSSLKGNEFEILSKNSEISNAIKTFQKEIKEKEEQTQILNTSILNYESNLVINIGTVEELKNKILLTKNIVKELEEKLIEVKRNLSEKHSNLNRQDNKLKGLSKNINETEATHNMLSNLEKHYEGYNRTVKTLMEHIDRKQVTGISDVKVLGEVFKVEADFEVAIEIALAGAISNVITTNEEDAKKLIGYLKAKSLGRATFLPLNIIKGKRLDIPNNIKNTNGYLGIASELISYEDKFKNIIDYSLGRTIIAKDMDCAINISKLGRHSYRIVTLTGEVINPGGALTGGSIQGKNTNLLGRKREIEELSVKVTTLKKDYNEQKDIFDSIKLAIKKLDDEILNIREEIHEKNIDLTVFDGEIKGLKNEGHKLREDLDITKKKVIANSEKIEILKNNMNTKESELSKLGAKSVEEKEKTKELQNSLVDKKEELECLKEKLTNIKINKATLEESIQGQRYQLSTKVTDIKEKSSKILFLESEIEEKRKSIEILKNDIISKENKIIEINNRLKSLEDIFKADEIKRASLKEEYKVRETNTNDIKEILRNIENDFNKKAIYNARLESEQESFYNKLNTELNLTLAQAKEIAVEIEDIHAIKDAISKLKSKIAALGVINLSSIVEYDEVCEKYEFMANQELDLQKAKDELLGVIAEMTENMQVLFKENFKILNENFGETFKELFKGGTGELILADEDVLNSNIIINVQPPGKKLQNINLMSGGEKVLSAIALLFAILKMKPTPFCILDEIEAALDDANVYRYAEFLKAFSGNIQFIVITHRKGTMEASDVMYGVTMEEKGISKVVSVDLSSN